MIDSVLFYVSFLTFWILKMDLRIGARSFGLLINTTFIKSPTVFTTYYSENNYYNSKNSCYPDSRTTAGNHASDAKCNPKIVSPAHFLHIVNTPDCCIYYILCTYRSIVTLYEKNFSAVKAYFNLIINK